MLTPQTESPEIAKELGLDKLYFKREDLHPLGSHKGRSIPVMIDLKIARGARDFVISSSGNAALAAIRHIKKLNSEGKDLTLSVLVGKSISKDKLNRLETEITEKTRGVIKLEKTERPLQSLLALIKTQGKTSLRQSTDLDALRGYEALADEIASLPNLAAVFIGTSSGTAAEALAAKLPGVNIVQTSSTHPLADIFDTEKPPLETSEADAIVDKIAHRKNSLETILRTNGGGGWIATNDDIHAAQKLMKDRAGIDTTANGALALAGLIHAIHTGAKFSGTVVCIVTGK